ncbi:hypothetical protein [Ruficoccus sp. ZRK36]|uniref:hypothetical protein n=1 Tax=Ruficoccus sp. ZRK36 TaxID=2866311 RepID=UPI001C73AD40|nr:hypothetical protein [Ruficoccus sp. ZRK36]QYY34490.1 hypothetical protein K0V07_09230 [Ruficoccus sp. ZRK36]
MSFSMDGGTYFEGGALSFLVARIVAQLVIALYVGLCVAKYVRFYQLQHDFMRSCEDADNKLYSVTYDNGQGLGKHRRFEYQKICREFRDLILMYKLSYERIGFIATAIYIQSLLDSFSDADFTIQDGEDEEEVQEVRKKASKIISGVEFSFGMLRPSAVDIFLRPFKSLSWKSGGDRAV